MVPYQRARELVNAAVPQHVEAWAGIIGLKSPDVRFTQFREDITEALHACMRAHEAAPHRSRWSDVRTDFMRVADAARAVTRDLRNLRAALACRLSDKDGRTRVGGGMQSSCVEAPGPPTSRTVRPADAQRLRRGRRTAALEGVERTGRIAAWTAPNEPCDVPPGCWSVPQDLPTPTPAK